MIATNANGPGGAFLELDDISKSFGAVPVIKDLSLRVNQGEFISLLGPSGCGKSTILRLIAGFLFPERGRILLEGQSIERVPSHKRGAAMVFQNYALFPHMSVYDNVAFGLRMRKTPKGDVPKRVTDALALVRLGEYGERYPRELSGGQQQRVALARAIVLNPKLLLLDEPLSNLDAKLRKQLRQELVEIHQLSGITTIFVTHDLEEAFSTSDRVGVMNNGRLEQFGTPSEIFSRPQTAFIADFVGHSNMFEGVIGSDDESASRAHRRWAPDSRVDAEGADGRRRKFAIPAHLLRLHDSPVPADNCFPARLVQAAFLGSTIQVQVELGGMILQGQLPANAAGGLPSNKQVHLAWRAADMIEIPGQTTGAA